MELQNKGQYRQALLLAKQFLINQEKLQTTPPSFQIKALCLVAGLHGDLSEYSEAITVYDQALILVKKNPGLKQPEAANIFINMAGIYQAMGDFEKAESLYRMALIIYENAEEQSQAEVAALFNNIGSLHYDLGDYERAIAFYQKAFQKNKDLFGFKHPSVARNINNLAETYQALGDYQEAETLYKKALSIRKQALNPDHPDLAISLNGLGSFYYSLGDIQQAENYFKKALAIREKAYGPDHPQVAKTLNDLALVYLSLREYSHAETTYKKVLTINEKIFGGTHPKVAANLHNLAGLYQEVGATDKSIPTYFKSLAIKEKVLGTSHPEYARTLNNLGALYQGIGDYKKAESYYLRALDIREKALGLEHPHIATSLNNLGTLYESMGLFEQAEMYYKKAVEIVERCRIRLENEELKMSFIQFYLPIYRNIISFFIEQHKRDQSKGFHRQALFYLERAKSRTFLDILGNKEVSLKNGEDQAILKKEKELQLKIKVLSQKKTFNPANQNIAQQLEKAQEDYRRLLNEIKFNNPELSYLISVNPSPVEKIQSLLDANTTLLEFYTTKNKLYSWLLTKTNCQVHEIAIKEGDIEKKVAELLNLVSSFQGRKPEPVIHPLPKETNPEAFSQIALDIYKLLIFPVEPDIKTNKLIIIPHGILHKIPFASLNNGQNTLIDQYALSILPAASILEYIIKKRKPRKESLLALANPIADYFPGFYELPCSEIEATKISRYFKQKEIYKRKSATEGMLKKKASTYGVIHLACHGEFNARQPMESGLLLAKDDKNDGFLHAHEIFGMDLKNANLVILSACETALSKILGGDDLVGLSRGFIYAGTPSLLATLWKVDDVSTAKLMEFFYKNWKKGMSKPEALRQAQIALKAMPLYSHPFYWAPFVMIGDWR